MDSVWSEIDVNDELKSSNKTEITPLSDKQASARRSLEYISQTVHSASRVDNRIKSAHPMVRSTSLPIFEIRNASEDMVHHPYSRPETHKESTSQICQPIRHQNTIVDFKVDLVARLNAFGFKNDKQTNK